MNLKKALLTTLLCLISASSFSKTIEKEVYLVSSWFEKRDGDSQRLSNEDIETEIITISAKVKNLSETNVEYSKLRLNVNGKSFLLTSLSHKERADLICGLLDETKAIAHGASDSSFLNVSRSFFGVTVSDLFEYKEGISLVITEYTQGNYVTAKTLECSSEKRDVVYF